MICPLTQSLFGGTPAFSELIFSPVCRSVDFPLGSSLPPRTSLAPSPDLLAVLCAFPRLPPGAFLAVSPYPLTGLYLMLWRFRIFYSPFCCERQILTGPHHQGLPPIDSGLPPPGYACFGSPLLISKSESHSALFSPPPLPSSWPLMTKP